MNINISQEQRFLTSRKIYKVERAIVFIEKCLSHSVQPKFAQLPIGLKLKLNKDEIFKVQQRNLQDELKYKKNLLPVLKNTYNNLLLKFKKTTRSIYEYESFISKTKNEINFSEAKNNEARDRKLRLLISEKFKNFSKAEVFNLSSKKIPDEIINFLSLGKNYNIGGFSQGSNNFCEIDKLSNYFEYFARKNNIDEESIIKINSHATFTAFDLEKTQTYDARSGILKKFLRDNPDLCLIEVDKNISVCFIDRKDYHKKLSDLFDKDQNFEAVKKYDHKKEFENYNQLLTETFGQNCN